MPHEGAKPPMSKRRRRSLIVMTIAAISVGTGIAMLFVPVNSVSKQVQVSPGASASTALTIPEAGWVTVHVSQPPGMMTHYWMEGGTGMMQDQRMMQGSDAYSFWSNGGTYQFGASCSGQMTGTMTVWMNATWGMI